MNSPENGNRFAHPAPEVQAGLSREMEQNLRSAVTPERARLIAFAATQDKSLLLRVEYPVQPDLEEKIKRASADNLPFAAGEKVSEERRRDYWRERDRATLSFAEQNKQWNEGMHQAILGLITPPQDNDQERAQKAILARETLQHLGLTGAEAREEKIFTSPQGVEQRVNLYTDIEAFRTTYFTTKSDIKGFVQKIAEQCTGDNGQVVDVVALQKRLEAIKTILTSFGDQAVDNLVEDFAVSYGLLIQRGLESREVIADQTINWLHYPLDLEKRVLYDKLARKQEEIERPTTPAREEQEASREAVRPEQPPTEPRQPQEQPTEEPATAEREEKRVQEPPGEQAGAQPEAQVQPENREFEERIARIEQGLSEFQRREVILTPIMKEIIRSGVRIKNEPMEKEVITNSEFSTIFYNEYARLQAELSKPHNEIMRDLEQLFINNLKFDREINKFTVRHTYVDHSDYIDYPRE